MDETLIRRIKQGDEKAFDAVYREYYPLMCRFALQLLCSPELAEEVVDDVFFALWNQRSEIDIRSLKAYLLKAVRNKSLNEMNSLAHRRRQMTGRIDTHDRLDFLSSLFDDEHPLEQLLCKETEAQFRRIVDSLPEESRRVFMMQRMEGKKYAEIAMELGISVNTVKYHMKKTIRLLSEMLGKYLLLLLLLR